MKQLLRAGALLVLAFVLSLPCFAADDGKVKRPETVLALMKENKDLSRFVEMIADSGSEALFAAKPGNLTVFAPNNAAMGKLPSDVSKRIKSGKAEMKKFVTYHVISGSQVFLGNILNRRASPSAASGEMLGFDGTGKEPKVGDATIVTPDLVAQNGVVHVISAVLVPPSFSAPKVEMPPADIAPSPAETAVKAGVKKGEAAKAPEAAPKASVEPQQQAPQETKKSGWKSWFGF